MIVFAIVFGETYIDKFFDIALPSLLTPRNVPALVEKGVEVSLVLFTTESSVPLIAERVKSSIPGKEQFAHIDVSFLQDKPLSDYEDLDYWRSDTLRDLMMKVVAHCARADQPFIFTAADVMYSDGIIENSYQLHRTTGKVVATFNGRVDPGDDLDGFHRLLRDEENGYRKAFLKYRNALWKSWTVTSSEDFPDAGFGHVIVEEGEFVHLFCSNPNPFLGKFTTEDLVFFTESERYLDWDNRWRLYLASKNRLLVLSNLDAGMSIEIDPPAGDLKGLGNTRFLKNRRRRRAETQRLLEEWEMDIATYETAQRRAHFDTDFNMFCFTTRRCTGGQG
ncbi:MAG: hypothetical protein P8N43_12675 [Alphaproteobacteria bacterium]|nr:hypothetical protein [Alphaproteobacteria bacterium]